MHDSVHHWENLYILQSTAVRLYPFLGSHFYVQDSGIHGLANKGTTLAASATAGPSNQVAPLKWLRLQITVSDRIGSPPWSTLILHCQGWAGPAEREEHWQILSLDGFMIWPLHLIYADRSPAEGRGIQTTKTDYKISDL
jgi:hypothetical protein